MPVPDSILDRPCERSAGFAAVGPTAVGPTNRTIAAFLRAIDLKSPIVLVCIGGHQYICTPIHPCMHTPMYPYRAHPCVHFKPISPQVGPDSCGKSELVRQIAQLGQRQGQGQV